MKALVLAGGVPQIALIQDLRSRGITTVLCDYYKDPVAKPYADIFYRESTLDVPAITRVAKEENVDFLITCCTDQALMTVAQVSEELGLPCYIDYETARNVTNKSYMKQIFAEKGISSARFAVMGQLDMEAIAHLRYPLIVKPVDCNSSKGVQKVESAEKLAVAFETAVQLSRTKTAIVEEFITGPELSVDIYVEDGVAHVLSVSELDKLPEENKFIIFRAKSPAFMNETLMAHIQLTAQQIADAFGLKNSPMLIQMITDGTRGYVLEFSARTGGGEKFIMIPKVSGFDPVKAVVDLVLGEKPHVPQQRPKQSLFATEFIYCYDGIFHHFENFEELKAEGILAEYYCFRAPGSGFNGIDSSGDRVGGFSIVAESWEELQAKHRRAVAELRVIADDGSDLMRRDLLTDL